MIARKLLLPAMIGMCLLGGPVFSQELINASDSYLYGVGLTPGQYLFDCASGERVGVVVQVRDLGAFLRIDLADGRFVDLSASGVRQYCIKADKAVSDLVAAKLAELRKDSGDHRLLSVVVLKKDTTDGKIAAKIHIENRSAKEVKAFKGAVVISDVFGDVLGRLPIKIYEPSLKPGEARLATWTEYPITDRQRDLFSAPYKDLRFKWELEQVLFQDGSSWEASREER